MGNLGIYDQSYCGPAPSWDSLVTRWNFEPGLLLGLVIAAFCGWHFLRAAEHKQKLAFWAAWGGAVVLFVSPICALTVALLSARVSHHVLLTMVIAPLLALALPKAWGRKLSLLAMVIISTIALWLWHAPDIYAQAFLHPAVYWAMQLSLLTSFTLLWLGLWRAQNAVAAGVAALSSAMQMGLLGALFVFAPKPLFVPHFASSLGFGLSPLEDQQLAGLIMWVPANIPLLALAVWRLVSLLQGEREALR